MYDAKIEYQKHIDKEKEKYESKLETYMNKLENAQEKISKLQDIIEELRQKKSRKITFSSHPHSLFKSKK